MRKLRDRNIRTVLGQDGQKKIYYGRALASNDQRLAQAEVKEGLRAQGFAFEKSAGSHSVWYNKKTRQTIVVPKRISKSKAGAILGSVRQSRERNSAS